MAVWPPPGVLQGLAGLPRPEIAGLRWTTAEQWHVTLVFLGSVAGVEEATARLSGVEAPPGSPPVARLGPESTVLGGGPGGGVLALPVAGLDGLAAAVATAMAGIGQPVGQRDFSGHLTLARRRGGRPGLASEGGRDRRGTGRGGVASARDGWAGLAGQPFVARWVVERLSLVASDTRPEGAVYRVVAEQAVLPGRPGAGSR